MIIRRLVIPSITAVLVACSGSDTPPVEDLATIPIRVAAVELRTEEPPIVLTGILGAKEEIPLGFKIGGVVASVAADAGDRVRAGQLLASLSLTEIESSVAAAREGRDKARRDLARVERLHRDSVATIAQLEDARTGVEVAEAQLRAAEFNKQYAEVRAPADGVVLRRQVESGQLVGQGMPVFILRVERNGLVLRAGASDREAVRLRDGMRASVSFDAFPGEQFSGRIERVGVAASPMTGTYEIEIEVSAGSRALASGLVGRASVTPRGARAVPTVPTEALIEVDGRRATVFVLGADETSVRRAQVDVLWINGGVAAISGDLPADARIVTAGATRLSEASKVRLVTERAP